MIKRVADYWEDSIIKHPAVGSSIQESTVSASFFCVIHFCTFLRKWYGTETSCYGCSLILLFCSSSSLPLCCPAVRPELPLFYVSLQPLFLYFYIQDLRLDPWSITLKRNLCCITLASLLGSNRSCMPFVVIFLGIVYSTFHSSKRILILSCVLWFVGLLHIVLHLQRLAN